MKTMTAKDCRHDPVLTNKLYQYLRTLSDTGRVTDYTIAGSKVGRGPDDHQFHEMLGDVSSFSYRHFGIFLSALVQKRGKPNQVGTGLWDVVAECGAEIADDETVALVELVRDCFDWSRNKKDGE